MLKMDVFRREPWRKQWQYIVEFKTIYVLDTTGP